MRCCKLRSGLLGGLDQAEASRDHRRCWLPSSLPPLLSSLVMKALQRKQLPRARLGVGGQTPESPFPTSHSWVVSTAANPGCVALSQVWGSVRWLVHWLWKSWRQSLHPVCLCHLSTVAIDVFPPAPPPANPFQCQGVPHFQAMGKRRAEPMARGQHRCGPYCLASPDPGGIRPESRAWAAGVL